MSQEAAAQTGDLVTGVPELAVTVLLGLSAALTLTAILVAPLRQRLWPPGEKPEPPAAFAALLGLGLLLQLVLITQLEAWRNPFKNLGYWQLPVQALVSQALVAVAVAAALLGSRLGPARAVERLGLSGLRPGRLASGALTWLGALWLMVIVSVLWEMLVRRWSGRSPEAQEMIRLLRAVPDGPRVVTALVAVTLAPLLEETLFRGVLFASLRPRLGFWPAALASAAAFAALHGDLPRLLPLTFLGLVLAWLYERTGSLWPSVAMHAVQNAAAIIVALWTPA